MQPHGLPGIRSAGLGSPLKKSPPMPTPYWQIILQRGQQTIAVWNQHAPGFTVGTGAAKLTLAAHSAEVAALAPLGQGVENDQEPLDDARAERDGLAGEIGSFSVRLMRKLDGELAPDDTLHGDLGDVRAVRLVSLADALTRGQKTVAPWLKYNGRRAAAQPPEGPVLVGGKTQAQYAAMVAALPGKMQAVETLESDLNRARGDLRRLAAKVDSANKRWYAAWQGEFPAGTPEGDALSQITTEGGGAGSGEPGENPTPPPPPPLPGVATLGAATPQGDGSVTLSGMAAEGAASFAVDYRVTSGGGTSPNEVGSGITGDFNFTPPEGPNEYEARVAGENAAGRGEWSAPVPFTIV